MDDAIKDLIGQGRRAQGLKMPTPKQAVQTTLWTLASLAQTCEVVDYPPSFSKEDLEKEIVNTLEALMTLAALYDLSPIESLVRRLNRRITDA